MSTFRHAVTGIILVSMIPVLAPTAAKAFGTITFLGQNAEHEKITRLGLAGLDFGPESMDNIAGKSGTFGAVGSPDNPIRGLISRPEAHCDGGDYLAIPGYRQSKVDAQARLQECQDWIAKNMALAISQAARLLDENGDINDDEIIKGTTCTFDGKPKLAKCDVLEAIGTVIHASQDFYSHTNWSDAASPAPGTPKNPPGLGRSAPSQWVHTGSGVDFPDGLISGCFNGIPEFAHCRNRVRHQDLNKDKGAIDVETGAIGPGKTARAKGNDNFKRAVDVAIADTRIQWGLLEDGLLAAYGPASSALMICALKQDDPAKTCP